MNRFLLPTAQEARNLTNLIKANPHGHAFLLIIFNKINEAIDRGEFKCDVNTCEPHYHTSKCIDFVLGKLKEGFFQVPFNQIETTPETKLKMIISWDK